MSGVIIGKLAAAAVSADSAITAASPITPTLNSCKRGGRWAIRCSPPACLSAVSIISCVLQAELIELDLHATHSSTQLQCCSFVRWVVATTEKFLCLRAKSEAMLILLTVHFSISHKVRIPSRSLCRIAASILWRTTSISISPSTLYAAPS